ncbi:CsbD family protein [Sphingomonas donggukensis]|uniref:CsbD family protein n=1 Tax=Sphingomonas donggukensis TaxID=2949093 RepID=A0ABY4TPV7_9SPHN|nr:CsbD family protein [Sphingomonas donggukensis]URW74411.1 CsbD family protein [Sphingomonas donggukensis]
MGEFVDKVKGNANEAIGKAKQALAGDGADRNEKLAAEGAAQEGKGKAQQAVGSVKGALGDDI